MKTLKLFFCFAIFAVFFSCENMTTYTDYTENDDGNQVWIEHWGTKVSYKNLDAAFDWLQDNYSIFEYNDVYTILLGEDQFIKERVLRLENNAVVIRLKSKDGNEKQIGLVGGGSLFVLDTSGLIFVIDQGITLKGRNGSAHAVVEVMRGGFNMFPGSAIMDNFVFRDGSAVFVNGGGFIMHGGTIRGNHNCVYVVNHGTFDMYDGTINSTETYTETYYGGTSGVFVKNGTFRMSGGLISPSTSLSCLGVYVENGTFYMNNGTISNSSCGVSINNGSTFVMDNGTISGNKGGVEVRREANFTMNNGSIHGNSGYGGVSVNSATFTMNDGVISGNSNLFWGGGIRLVDSTFIKNGGTVFGNDGTENANVCRDSSGEIMTDRNIGHGIVCSAYNHLLAVYGIIRSMETTADSGVKLEFYYNNGYPTFSGNWDY